MKEMKKYLRYLKGKIFTTHIRSSDMYPIMGDYYTYNIFKEYMVFRYRYKSEILYTEDFQLTNVDYQSFIDKYKEMDDKLKSYQREETLKKIIDT